MSEYAGFPEANGDNVELVYTHVKFELDKAGITVCRMAGMQDGTVRGHKAIYSFAFAFPMIALLFSAGVAHSQQISTTDRVPLKPLVLESGVWTEAKFLVADVDYVFRPLPDSIRVKMSEPLLTSRNTLACAANRRLITGGWRWVDDVLVTVLVMIIATLGAILLLFCLSFFLAVTVRIFRGSQSCTFWHDCMDRISNPPIIYIWLLCMPVIITLTVLEFRFLEDTKLMSYVHSDPQNWASGENVVELWIDNSLDNIVRCEDINNPQHVVEVPENTIMKLSVSTGTLEMVISNGQQVLEKPTLAIRPNTQRSVFVYSVGRPDQFRVESKLYEL